MTKLICGKCGETFKSETEHDSDKYCQRCLNEINAETESDQRGHPHPTH
ncbi:MAG: hypothetical protein WC365_07510 [Candidatus Babeliales bacterium]|jgi:predicted amidophosphoribosyltransferase